jgi:WD40 repeat protein
VSRPGSNEPAAPTPVEPSHTRQAGEWKHTSPLLCCRFHAAGAYVFAGAQDNTIQRWELAGGQKTELTGHKSWVRALAFVQKDNLLISGDYHGRVLWWPADSATPTPIRNIEAHRGWVRAVAVSSDGQLLATCGNDRLVKLWSAADGKLVRALAGHDCHVYNVAFHPGGGRLVSADLKGVVQDWDLTKGRAERALDAGVLWKYDANFRADIGGVRGMAFSPDGALLACAGITDVTNAFAGVGKPAVVPFDWPSGQRKQLLRPKEDLQGTAWGVAFHPSGFLVGAGGGNAGALWFWKPEQPQSLHALKLPGGARDLDLHPDGRQMAVPFFDGAVRIYDLTPKAPG